MGTRHFDVTVKRTGCLTQLDVKNLHLAAVDLHHVWRHEKKPFSTNNVLFGLFCFFCFFFLAQTRTDDFDRIALFYFIFLFHFSDR